MREFQAFLLCHSLVVLYKQSIRPHLDNGDIIYDQIYMTEMESIQFNGELAIKGAIIGTSRENLYQELGLESLRKG